MDCDAHKKLRIPKTGSLYNYGKSDLFATVISLKYLLDTADFRMFYYDFKKIIKKYNLSLNTLDTMGFPENWMSILRIKVYWRLINAFRKYSIAKYKKEPYFKYTYQTL